VESEPIAGSLSAIEKPIEKVQASPSNASGAFELGRGVSWRRFDPNVQVTECMTWLGLQKQTRHRPLGRRPETGPTWGSLLRRVVFGLVEVLVPLAFIIGMVYWRSPWLFRALMHFLRGEPVFNF
jgi:hypothetical protein